VLPCDQYRVRPEQLRALVDAWCAAPEQPAAAHYDGTLGVPVIWPAGWFDRLTRARRGQALLDPANCTAFPLSEASVDLDTPADLAALERFCASGAG
ncbi:MAG: NTP transferase domain-containing protein, partial [Pseudomonadota bacterium]